MPAREQCHSVTDEDVRCTRVSLPGRRYCWQHESTLLQISVIGVISALLTVLGLVADLSGLGLITTPKVSNPSSTGSFDGGSASLATMTLTPQAETATPTIAIEKVDNPSIASVPTFGPQPVESSIAGARFPPNDDMSGLIGFRRGKEFIVAELESEDGYQLVNEHVMFPEEPGVLCVRVAPGGRKVSFSANLEIQTEIYIVKPESSRGFNLTKNVGWESTCSAWSPDGSRLLIYRQYSIDSDILVIDDNGANERNLTNISSLGTSSWNNFSDAPWSPDGTQIVFSSNRSGNYELYLMDVESTRIERLTFDETSDYAPTWSPDGNQIAFVSQGTDLAGEIMVMSLDDHRPLEARAIASHEAHDTDPNWSPDGSKLIFSSNRDGSRDIFLIDLEKDTLSKVTNTLEDEYNLIWIR